MILSSFLNKYWTNRGSHNHSLGTTSVAIMCRWRHQFLSFSVPQFLNYHMLGQVVYTSGIQSGLRHRYTTLAGDRLDLRKGNRVEDPILVNGEARIVDSDVEVENGVIHVIDTVLNCPCLRKDEVNVVPP